MGGLPTDLEESPVSTILADSRMTLEVSEVNPGQLEAACTGDGGGATPARRLLSTGQGLQDDGSTLVVGSLCQPNYQGFFGRLVDAIGGRLGALCPE